MTYTAKLGKNTPSLTDFTGKNDTGDVTFELHFQDGVLSHYGVNGTTNEEILHVLIERLNSLNGVMHSDWNDSAIFALQFALFSLDQRTKDRLTRGVEGTHNP